jgi:uncharacterized secreted protein with C-terminal beta-propeller domain
VRPLAGKGIIRYVMMTTNMADSPNVNLKNVNLQRSIFYSWSLVRTTDTRYIIPLMDARAFNYSKRGDDFSNY